MHDFRRIITALNCLYESSPVYLTTLKILVFSLYSQACLFANSECISTLELCNCECVSHYLLCRKSKMTIWLKLSLKNLILKKQTLQN